MELVALVLKVAVISDVGKNDKEKNLNFSYSPLSIQSQ